MYFISLCCTTLHNFVRHLKLFSSTAVECPALPLIPNGNITYGPDMTADFAVGTVATHTCNEGYLLLGSETRECLVGGRWSSLTPVCQRT